MISRLDLSAADLPATVPVTVDGRDFSLVFLYNQRDDSFACECWRGDVLLYSAPLLYASPIVHAVIDINIPRIAVLRPADFRESFSSELTLSSESLGRECAIYVEDDA